MLETLLSSFSIIFHHGLIQTPVLLLHLCTIVNLKKFSGHALPVGFNFRPVRLLKGRGNLHYLLTALRHKIGYTHKFQKNLSDGRGHLCCFKFIICLSYSIGAGFRTGFAGMSASLLMISPITLCNPGYPGLWGCWHCFASDVLASAVAAIHCSKHKIWILKTGLVSSGGSMRTWLELDPAWSPTLQWAAFSFMTLLLGIKFAPSIKPASDHQGLMTGTSPKALCAVCEPTGITSSALSAALWARAAAWWSADPDQCAGLWPQNSCQHRCFYHSLYGLYQRN